VTKILTEANKKENNFRAQKCFKEFFESIEIRKMNNRYFLICCTNAIIATIFVVSRLLPASKTVLVSGSNFGHLDPVNLHDELSHSRMRGISGAFQNETGVDTLDKAKLLAPESVQAHALNMIAKAQVC
jgi:hypothetical protein